MATGLGYESPAERKAYFQASRRALLNRIVLIGVIAAIAVFTLVGLFYHLMDQPTLNHVTLTIKNQTSATLTDVGFSDYENERVVSMGPVAPGKTKTASFDYNEDFCPTGFSFDQSAQTFRVPLSKEMLEEGDVYTIVVTPNLLIAQCTKANGATTRYAQTPATQPIVYP